MCLCRSQTAWKTPACIYATRNADNLSEAIQIFQSTNTSFAIRGGGHNPLPGWANIDNGVLVSLQLLSNVEYNSTTKTVRVGFSNTWGGIYTSLEKHRRVVVGGRVPSVGLGLLTGGMHLFFHYSSVHEAKLRKVAFRITQVSMASHQIMFCHMSWYSQTALRLL